MLKLSIALISKWDAGKQQKKPEQGLWQRLEHSKKAAGDFDISALGEEGSMFKTVVKTQHCLNS